MRHPCLFYRSKCHSSETTCTRTICSPPHETIKIRKSMVSSSYNHLLSLLLRITAVNSVHKALPIHREEILHLPCSHPLSVSICIIRKYGGFPFRKSCEPEVLFLSAHIPAGRISPPVVPHRITHRIAPFPDLQISLLTVWYTPARLQAFQISCEPAQ